MNPPDPKLVVEHVIRLMGGHDKAFAQFDAELLYVDKHWEQDTAIIGRILRAHLFVEHFLTEYIQLRNPELGSLGEARVSFSQKIALVGVGPASISYLIPGIRHLNKIRNRLAHTLRAEVSEDDANVFLQIEFFRAMRKEKAKRFGNPSSDPIDVLEEFARHAGGMLRGQSSRSWEVWAEAIRTVKEESERGLPTQPSQTHYSDEQPPAS